MFILGKLHAIRNMIILIQKPKIRFIFNSQKPKNSVISTNICKIIIKLLSILVPNQTNFVTVKCHLDPANLNSQTRPQSHEFNNIHTHTHTQTKLRIWNINNSVINKKTILIQSENGYNETRTHTHKNFTYNNIKQIKPVLNEI